MKGKYVNKEGPNDWKLHQSKPICLIASAILNQKSKRLKATSNFKHDMESKTKDDEKLKQINTCISMNYQRKPMPF